MFKIKICGITNIEDALLAASLGANALGFIFAKSPRQVSVNSVQEISAKLPPFLSKIGIFVNESVDQVNETVKQCGLNAVQLHGTETPEHCRQVHAPVIKAFHLKKPEDLEQIKQYEDCVSAFLFDSSTENQPGGTGTTFDWKLLAELNTAKPVIIAGGMSIENIPLLMEHLSPYAVDVNSGIESSPGKKDPEKMRQLFLLLKNLG
ncbi:MAG: phosphoribosylanthranilate isomerase [Candidatus Margulisiibacteriota bacterium]|jgi:phosphoribosylanthranilate isomerase